MGKKALLVINIYANKLNKSEASININAPPILDDICANGISFILSEADNTATSPVPPIFDIHRPAVIADSIG